MRKIHLFMDGNQIAATWDSFDCLAVSPAGFGDTVGESITDLIKNTQAYELNSIVSSIENAPPNTAESPAIPQQPQGEICHDDLHFGLGVISGTETYRCYKCGWEGKLSPVR